MDTTPTLKELRDNWDAIFPWDEVVNPDTIAEYEDARIDWDQIIKKANQ
jgi:hypothetical protein